MKQTEEKEKRRRQKRRRVKTAVVVSIKVKLITTTKSYTDKVTENFKVNTKTKKKQLSAPDSS